MRGKARLARILLRADLDARDVVLRDRRAGSFLVPSLREPIAFHLLTDGTYEGAALEVVLGHLRAGSVLADVGANIGVFTVPAARTVGPSGRVVAIEPSARVFPYLQWNAALNGLTNVSLHRCAASDRSAAALPFFEAPAERFGMGSLAPQFHGQPVGVRAATLGELLASSGVERADVLKVDVEGFEASVFRGAERLLTGEAPPLVVFEFCDWAEARVPGGRVGDAQRALRAWEYQVWRLADFARGRAPLLDTLTVGFETLVALKR